MSKLVNLKGRTFERLTVIRRSFLRTDGTWWECACSCGNTKLVKAPALCRGLTRSCGCLRRELARESSRKHGLSKLPEYKIWLGIKKRCLNKKAYGYRYYGGKGITVCERWLEGFPNFYNDMGPRPSPKHSVERVNNAGNYEPSNCKWATNAEQYRNTSIIKLYEWEGEMLTLRELAAKFNIPPKRLSGRLKKGWGLELSLKLPLQRTRTKIDPDASISELVAPKKPKKESNKIGFDSK